MPWDAGGGEFGGRVSLILLAVLVVAFVVYRKRSAGRVDAGSMARRLLELGFLKGLVLAVSLGTTGLLGRLFDRFRDGYAGDAEGLALWLSLLIVAGGALVGLSLWLRRRFHKDPAEAETTGWTLYLASVDLTATGFVVAGVAQTLGWVLDGWDLDTWMLASAIVWTVVAVVHTRLPGRRPAVFDLVGSTVALIGVAISLAVILENLLEWAYDGSTSEPISGLGRDEDWSKTVNDVAGAVGPLLAFGGAWIRYWWVSARRTFRSLERDGYVLVVGVLGGLATTVVAAGGLLHTALSWVFVGSARDLGAVAHFDVVTIYGALLLLGLALWAYHRSEVPHAVNRRVADRDEVARLYDHLEAGVGLVAGTLGLGLLLGALLHKVMPAPEDWDRDIAEVMALALTFLLAGFPVWGRAWSRIQGHAGTPAEESSAVRRIYLFTIFGATALGVLVSLGTMVYLVLFGLLDGSLDVEKVAIFRFPLAVIGATAGVAAYHGQVLRSGLQAVPASTRPALRTVTVVGAELSDLVKRLEEIPGVSVISRLRLDSSGVAPADPDELVELVAASMDNLVVVLGEAGSIEVIPIAS